MLKYLLPTSLLIILFSTFTQCSTLTTSSSFLNKNSTLAYQKLTEKYYCYGDKYCEHKIGPNSRCFKGNCICNLGYLNETTNSCTKKDCTVKSDCTAHFPLTECSTSSSGKGKCICAEDMKFDEASQRCKLSFCSTFSDCQSKSSYGVYSFCNGTNSKCECNLGYSLDFDGSGICRPLKCANNFDCSSRWPNTECSMGSCNCVNDFGMLESTQTCVRKDFYDGNKGLTYFMIVFIVLILVFFTLSFISVSLKIRRQLREQRIRHNSNNNQQPTNRRLPVPQTENSIYHPMDAPPPTYDEVVQGEPVVVQVDYSKNAGFSLAVHNESPPPPYIVENNKN